MHLWPHDRPCPRSCVRRLGKLHSHRHNALRYRMRRSRCDRHSCSAEAHRWGTRRSFRHRPQQRRSRPKKHGILSPLRRAHRWDTPRLFHRRPRPHHRRQTPRDIPFRLREDLCPRRPACHLSSRSRPLRKRSPSSMQPLEHMPRTRPFHRRRHRHRARREDASGRECTSSSHRCRSSSDPPRIHRACKADHRRCRRRRERSLGTDRSSWSSDMHQDLGTRSRRHRHTRRPSTSSYADNPPPRCSPCVSGK